MESVSAGGIRQLLLGRNRCLSCSRRYLSPKNPLSLSPAFPARHYASTPNNRRKATHNNNGSDDTQNDGNPLEDSESTQAHPISGYYSLILSAPSPYSQATTSRPAAESPTPVEQSPQEKMSIVFGSRLTSPGRSSRYNPSTTSPESSWKTVNGVPIPPKPEEPDNCCMSGCAHCVWDDYRDEMEDWAGRLVKAKAKGASQIATAEIRQTPRPEVDSASTSMDDDGGGSDTNWSIPEQNDDLFASIPVGIREFMKTEKKLKQRHKDEANA
ncbi:hypothetical protein ASPWEDRAFT_43221 [Aspergillus wentii DTO 134E9]|uniref:Oxidoreductase-like domain-containing protein n=1 Tax=Aspergillus wentii DTO 134E9 TaxID=1073089 RepID=A0A1L9RDY4_ASPWE|nr:uncharacterized protein ASPWEDRAFT_43221 [Aspergillus wentii DTO 134E9]KAI9933413.1 hypothetical protein MW887_007886 [Aspergillus wentii]OJJ33149.1 hypothetical protein ASPWEDRAFT_43221 [Aspergillus wentii DTO 134E9]